MMIVIISIGADLPEESISSILAVVGLTRSATPLTGNWSWRRFLSRTGRKRSSWEAVTGRVRRARRSSSLQKEETQMVV